jgi:pyrroloquinoline-quinone synthase
MQLDAEDVEAKVDVDGIKWSRLTIPSSTLTKRPAPVCFSCNLEALSTFTLCHYCTLRRIHDHDGYGDKPGGIEAWTRLGEATGLSRDELWSLKKVQPGVKFAVDAYVNFARSKPWQEAVCSSLTEMFAPKIHKDRLANWPTHYPWVKEEGLAYFRSRVILAERDVEHGLQVTLDYFTTREQQERALEILQFKLDVLWQISDAIEKAYP